MKRATHLLISLILVGCVSAGRMVWYKDGVSRPQFRIDHQECIYDAGKSTQQPNYAIPSRLAQDIDRSLREGDLVSRCMIAKGYFRRPSSAVGGTNLEGVQVDKVLPGSNAASEGIQSGDLILEVSQNPVIFPREVTLLLDDYRRLGQSVLILISQQGRLRFVALKQDIQNGGMVFEADSSP